MPTINPQKFDRELKKGGAELLVLSLLEARPRHGYEVRKLIETRSDGVLKFNAASLYLLVLRQNSVRPVFSITSSSCSPLVAVM